MESGITLRVDRGKHSGPVQRCSESFVIDSIVQTFDKPAVLQRF
jgi:hypothetical protein